MVARFLSRILALAGASVLLVACSIDDQVAGFLGRSPSSDITISSSAIIENGAPGEVVVTLHNPAATETIIAYQSTGGTADDGTDYTALDDSVTIAAGQTTATFNVTTIDDGIYEADETFQISYTVPPGLKLSQTVFNYTIQDDEPMPSVSFTSADQTVNESVGDVVVDLELSGMSKFPTLVNYTLTGTATGSGTDYTLNPGTVTFAAGSTAASLTIAIINDGDFEPAETILLTLSSPQGALVGLTADHDVTIMDDDDVDAITISNLNVTGIADNDFEVSVDFYGDTNANSTVTLYYCNSADAPGCDPVADGVAMVMVRGAGVFAASVTDLAYPHEPGETFNVAVIATDVDGVAGSPLTDSFQLLPVIDVQEMAKMEGESFDFVVAINRPYSADVTFNYATGATTATSGVDFTPLFGSATISAGETFVVLPSVSTNDDAASEPTEIFQMTLTSPVNAIIRNASAGGRILDNDPGLTWDKGLSGVVKAIAPQPDGKKVLGGNLRWDDTINEGVVRVGADGSESLSFHPGSGFHGGASNWLLQPDGKYLASGSFTEYDGVPRNHIVRINADGTLDTAFDPGTGADNRIVGMALQSDGRIIIFGDFTNFNGTARPNIARLNTDGSLDLSFDAGTATSYINSVAIQNDGKIIVVGGFTTFNGTARVRVARLNSDGSLDLTFNPGSGATGQVATLALQEDGKILIGGWFTSYGGTGRNRIARVNADGTLDTTFNPGSGFDNSVSDILIQPDGKILIVGSFTTYNGTSRVRAVRVEANGSLDATFNPGAGAVWAGSGGTITSISTIKMQNDGKFLIGGNFTTYNNSFAPRIARINADGSFDSSFDAGNGMVNAVGSIVLRRNGDALLSGNFTSYQGIRASVLRLNSDRTLDLTFDAGLGAQDGAVEDVVRQNDGKLIVGGTFTNFNGSAKNRLVRLNDDGSLDNTFVGTGANDFIHKLALQADGKIVIAGRLTSYNGTTRNRIARVNADGTLDSTFNPGSGPNTSLNALSIREDGKIFIGGGFNTYNGSSVNSVALLNDNGSRDVSFAGSGSSWIYSLIPLDDGKVLIGGNFMLYAFTSRNGIARSNANGTLDTSFDPGTGFSVGQVYDLAVTSDGGIFAVGSFTGFNGVPRNKIARINSDGTLDTNFDPGTGIGGANADGIMDILVEEDGTILIGGTFSSYDGIPARNYYEIPPPSGISVGNLALGGASNNSFDASIGFYGDANSNASALLWYCNETDSPGCDPTTGTSVAMARNGQLFEVSVAGLNTPNDPGDRLNIRVVVTDADGVTGSPLNGTVDLLPLLTISDATVVEGAGAQLIVSINQAISTDVTFDWATQDGSATSAGGDYTAEGPTGATIAAGQTSITLPSVTTSAADGAEAAEYFTIQLSNLSGAAAGDLEGRVDLVDATDGIEISNLTTSNITATGFDAEIDFTGDANADAVVTLWYCNNTDSAGCDPESGTSVAMARGTGVYTASVSGLSSPNDPGDQLSLRVVVSDAGGVSGSPLDGSVTLTVGGADDITISNLTLTYASENDFEMDVLFAGDDNANGTMTFYYCNSTDYPACDPILDGASLVMNRGVGVATATVNNLPYPHEPGETFNVAVVAADADGVTGSPLTTSFQLLPVLDVAETAQMEGDDLVFTVTINRPSASDVVFNWATSDGTAMSGADYTVDSGVATIISGSTWVNLPAIATNDDGIGEGTETLNLTISVPSNAVVRTATSSGYILDNDPGMAWPAGLNGGVNALAIQPDGKKVVGGGFTSWDTTLNSYAVRVKPDGNEDLSFFTGGGFDGNINHWIRQPNGKYIAVGAFQDYNGTAKSRIARINSDGSVDTAFDPGTGVNWYISSAAVQGDGKIIIGGYFTNYNGTARNYIARINSDGSLDATFNPGTGFNDQVDVIAIQSDGKIVVGGRFTSFNGTVRNRIVRLNLDGSLDTSFDPGTGMNGGSNRLYDLAIQPDGKIVIAGWFTSYNGTARNYVARVNSNGTLDATFDPGTGADTIAYAIGLQADGKVVVGGQFANFNGEPRSGIVRLNGDGSVDLSFDPGAGITGPGKAVKSLVIQNDGKIMIAGMFTAYNGTARNYVARINSDGSLDSSFNPGSGPTAAVEAINVQHDGHIIIGGGFQSYDGSIARNRVARINSDESLDLSFDPGDGANDSVNALRLQPDGRILIGGIFTSYNGNVRNRVARLNADGSLDGSFDPGTGADQAVLGLALQSDGKVIIGGNFTNYNGTARGRIARVDTDGSLDLSFDPGSGADSTVSEVAWQEDGKIVIAGWLSDYNGTGRARLARLNSDGSLDTSLDPGLGTSMAIRSMAVQPDGKIIIGGFFSSYNGTMRRGIARVNVDGSADTSFDPGDGLGGTFNIAEAITLQNDGKVLIGGSFTDYDGVNRNRIARANSNGTLDATYDPGTGFDSDVLDIAIADDGKIVAGGSFSRYNGAGAWRVKSIAAPDHASVANLIISNVTGSSFDARIGLYGDADGDSSSVLWYCNEGDSSGCDPTTGTSLPMSRNGQSFEVPVAGLSSPNDPGDRLNIRVVVTDADGVTGSPLNATVDLLPELTISDATVMEGSSAQLVVSINQAMSSDVTFDWATQDGSATSADGDYTPVSATAATIAAGQTSVTLPAVATSTASGAEAAEYFTVNLSNISGAFTVDVEGRVDLVDSNNGILVSDLTTSNILPTGFDAEIDFTGDTDADAVVTLWYCNNTDSAGCDPLTGTSVAMSRGAGVYTATVSGLSAPNDPGDNLFLRVVVADAGGVVGSPLDNNVTLLGDTEINIQNPLITNVTATGFDAQIDFAHDSNVNGTVTLLYCNETDSPGCTPSTSLGGMIRGSGVFTLSVTGLSAPDDPGDTLRVRFLASDDSVNFGINESVALSAANPDDMTISNLSVTPMGPNGFTATVDYTGDGNEDGAVTLWYCNHTDSPGCDPTSGTSVVMSRSTGKFAAIISNLTAPDDPGDTLNVRAVASDTDGTSGSPLDSAVTLTGVIMVYRSVGPGTTWPIALGPAGGTLSILNGVATFSSPLPGYVGVGDLIRYRSGGGCSTPNTTAFIHGRISSTVFQVRTAAGSANPNNTTAADRCWSIFRAYTSLSNAATQTENTASGAGDFDTSRDLVAGNKVWNIALYGDAADTVNTSFSGWSTDATRYLKVYTPVEANEVGVSQRHRGVWANDAYRIVAPAIAWQSPLHVPAIYSKIEGLQIEIVNPQSGTINIVVGNPAAFADVEISNNILRHSGTVTGGDYVGGVSVAEVAPGGTYSIFNNIIYDIKTISLSGGIIFAPDAVGDNGFIYNNTVYNANREGIVKTATGSMPVTIKNNIVQNSGVADYSGSWTDEANNLSGDNSAPGSSFDGMDVAFVDEADRDLRLLASDSAAQNVGVDLSLDAGLSFVLDALGLMRNIPWDIGAFSRGWVQMADRDGSGVTEFGAGSTSNIEWSTNELRLTAATESDRELDISDTDINLTGIVGIWHLNEANMNNGATVTDYSGNGHSGTIVHGGGNKSVVGHIGGAMSFDGNNDYINMGSPASLNNLPAVTAAAWVKLSVVPAGSYAVILDKNDGSGGWYLTVGDDPTSCDVSGAYIYAGADYSSSSVEKGTCTGLPIGKWVHVAFTWDRTRFASGLKVYANGVEQIATSTSDAGGGDTYNDSANPLRIGSNSAFAFNGNIDEVVIFNRMLSAAEISQLYMKGAAAYQSSVGEFVSRVFDAGTLIEWQSLAAVPRAPYDQAIRILGNETETYAAGVAPSELVSYIPFDESGVNENSPTNRVADVKTGVRGTMDSGEGATVKTVSGKFGNALSFDGESGDPNQADYVQFSNSGGQYTWNAGQSRSISLWVKPTTIPTTDYHMIFAQHPAGMYAQVFAVYFSCYNSCTDHSLIPTVEIDNGADGVAAASYEAIKLNEWNHLAIIYDHTKTQNNRFKIYVNGFETSLHSESWGTLNSSDVFSGVLEFGNESWDFEDRFIGAIDEFAMWSKALTDQEVADLYLRGVARLMYQVRSCDDGTCSGETWMGPDGTDATYFTEAINKRLGTPLFSLPSIVPQNRYFQYKVIFETDDRRFSPALREIKVDGHN